MSAEGTISSLRNPAVMAAVGLHRARQRRTTHRTLVEGPSTVGEAISAGVAVYEIFGIDGAARSLAIDSGAIYHHVTEQVLGRVSGTESPRGPIAVIGLPESVVATDRRLLVAWGVSDPGNCGTLLRTAAAFGYGYVAGPESADSWSPKVLRSAAGGHFRTTVGEIASLGYLGQREFVGTVPAGGEAAGRVGDRTAIIIGSEAHGLSSDVLDQCDRLVSIPMPGGMESLNAAVAGAIIAYLGVVGDGGS